MAVRAKDIIDRAMSISGTYLMGGGGPHFWDCSGFVGYCVTGSYSHPFATAGEGPYLSGLGFKDVSGSVNFATGAGMKKGDILIWNKGDGLGANGHTEIYWGGGTTLGASGSQGRPVGMARGPRSVSYTPWQQCWRPKSGVALVRWESS